TLFDVQVINDPDPGPPAEPGRVRLHITTLQGPVSASFPCTIEDPFRATASAQISVDFS
ncbi:MAG: hypothetical protein QOJ74_1859, partial [Ilumatobacteraceae bacterium]|nr:hypothetical protein [Ilumatobacteraceae bacterium]